MQVIAGAGTALHTLMSTAAACSLIQSWDTGSALLLLDRAMHSWVMYTSK
jgi:hypothetical protein